MGGYYLNRLLLPVDSLLTGSSRKLNNLYSARIDFPRCTPCGCRTFPSAAVSSTRSSVFSLNAIAVVARGSLLYGGKQADLAVVFSLRSLKTHHTCERSDGECMCLCL